MPMYTYKRPLILKWRSVITCIDWCLCRLRMTQQCEGRQEPRCMAPGVVPCPDCICCKLTQLTHNHEARAHGRNKTAAPAAAQRCLCLHPLVCLTQHRCHDYATLKLQQQQQGCWHGGPDAAILSLLKSKPLQLQLAYRQLVGKAVAFCRA